jgi:hypothetical protein
MMTINHVKITPQPLNNERHSLVMNQMFLWTCLFEKKKICFPKFHVCIVLFNFVIFPEPKFRREPYLLSAKGL